MNTVSLSSIIKTLETGARPKGGVSSLDSGIPSLGGEHLTNTGDFDFSKEKYIPEDFFHNLNRGQISQNDILIVKDGATTGKSSFVDNNFPFKQAAINEHLFLLRVDLEKAIPKYVFYFLHSNYGKGEILKDFRGATVGGISRGFIDKVNIPLFDLSAQREIVAALDKTKSLIDLRLKELKTLEKLERNLFLHHFQRYLITADNEFHSLDQIADVVSGITKGRKTKEVELKEVPYLRVANVQDGYFDLSEIKTIEATAAEIERYRIEKGDLLLTEGGDRDKLGRGNVWMDDETDFIFQNHLFRVRIKDQENYRPSFLNGLTRSDFGRAYFRKQAKQTTGIASINSRQIKAFPVPNISMEEQVIFEQELDAIKAMHRKLQHASLPDLENLFQSLLQRAFHGDLTIDPDLQLDGYLESENFNAIAADAVLIQTLIDRFNQAKTDALAEVLEEDREEESEPFRFETEAAYNRAKDALFHLLKEGLVTQKAPENEEALFKTYLATS